MSTAIVVGAGPNGLGAAVTLAKAGLQVTVLEAADEIGGGTRTSEAVSPGLLHDHCSAIHPMAIGSPFLTGLGLERHGLTWRLPEIDCVHPLDDGLAGVLYRSVDATADGLGADGPPVPMPCGENAQPDRRRHRIVQRPKGVRRNASEQSPRLPGAEPPGKCGRGQQGWGGGPPPPSPRGGAPPPPAPWAPPRRAPPPPRTARAAA
ncbi:hypothetical protein A5764_25320 [Mycobacterium sp. 852002-51057_SCH5723018]|nr:hypothetical protein A5764_25320 [Mycobacterium sp. 852002-51057_SCH5723018]